MKIEGRMETILLELHHNFYHLFLKERNGKPVLHIKLQMLYGAICLGSICYS